MWPSEAVNIFSLSPRSSTIQDRLVQSKRPDSNNPSVLDVDKNRASNRATRKDLF